MYIQAPSHIQERQCPDHVRTACGGRYNDVTSNALLRRKSHCYGATSDIIMGSHSIVIGDSGGIVVVTSNIVMA